eukprot:g13637.t1
MSLSILDNVCFFSIDITDMISYAQFSAKAALLDLVQRQREIIITLPTFFRHAFMMTFRPEHGATSCLTCIAEIAGAEDLLDGTLLAMTVLTGSFTKRCSFSTLALNYFCYNSRSTSATTHH